MRQVIGFYLLMRFGVSAHSALCIPSIKANHIPLLAGPYRAGLFLLSTMETSLFQRFRVEGMRNCAFSPRQARYDRPRRPVHAPEIAALTHPVGSLLL
jgi:hypothetical protein